MPIVPKKTEQQIIPAGIPDIRARSTASLPTFGGGTALDRQENIGREILGTAFKVSESERKRLKEERIREKQEMDKTIVLDADLQAAKLQNDIDLQVRNMKGRDSVNAMKFVDTEWEAGVNDINSTLFNQDQRDVFSIAAEKRFLSLRKGAGVHMDTQLTQYDQGIRKASINVAQEQAAINYTDLEFVVEQFGKQEALITDTAEKYGRGAQWRDDEIMKARSRTHAGIIKRMMFDGEIDLAKQYTEAVKGQLLNDDLASIRKLGTEEKRLKLIRDDDFNRGLWKRQAEGDLTNAEIDTLFFETKQIKEPLWKSLIRANNDVYDDDSIPEEEKTKILFELYDDYEKLRGSKVDKKGRIVRRAKGNTLAELQAFREKVADKKGYLRRPEAEAFIDYTEQNYTEAREGKFGIWVALRQKLNSLTENQQLIALALSRSFGPIFSPLATPVQAQKIADETVDAAVLNANPNASQYKIDQIIALPSGNWKVTGFADDGEPLVEQVPFRSQ